MDKLNMHRRGFSKTAGATALAFLGGSSDAGKRDSHAPAGSFTDPALASSSGSGTVRAPSSGPGPAIGTNLSGMEWAKPGLRYGQSTVPNLNFTVPRKQDVSYLASCGFTKNRLPIQWELLQPMLHDTKANAVAREKIGHPGEFHPGYESYITSVLDAHAAVGITCIVDCHNYCRYQDFRFQPDGSVIGLTTPSDPVLRAFTSDPSQVQVRIFALAAGATLKRSNFNDFWTRAARKWKDHPGFGGYGLMNEPNNMPGVGALEPGGAEDLLIWPTYAQSAIDAIRAIDPLNPIYLTGNEWGSAMSIATKNPTWPLASANLIYEVHMYLDAASSGAYFDFDTEVAKGYSAGGSGPIHLDTGLQRIRMATDWARSKGVRLALTEVGMPVDDPRWEEMFKRTVSHAWQQGCEIYSWMGGNHWAIHSFPINHVPAWHQNRTMDAAVSGPLQASAGIPRASLFDDGPGWAPAGTPVTITLYARGNLARPVTLTVTSNNGGTLSKSRLTIPAGANGSDTYTYTSAPNRVATLTYASDGQLSGQVPPPRKVYSLSDPVAYASTSLPDAAMAIIARYSACKWDLADGHTDYMLGAPAVDGQVVRAISDTGYGSTPGNPMEMINWINKDSSAMGSMSLPVMRVSNGKKNSDHSARDTYGFWCKKAAAIPGVQANPRSRVPYNIEDAHFVIAVISVPRDDNTGLVFQASRGEELYSSELAFVGGQPQARWTDARGQKAVLTSPVRPPAGAPAVVALTSHPGAQSLRVNSAVVAQGGVSFAPSAFTQMLIGWGYLSYYPRGGFAGNIFAVITGKGRPSAREMSVLERYLGGHAGMVLPA